jgi:hypothetical protein
MAELEVERNRFLEEARRLKVCMHVCVCLCTYEATYTLNHYIYTQTRMAELEVERNMFLE